MRLIKDIHTSAFISLIEAGLWERNLVRPVSFSDLDLEIVYRLAKEQAVVGLLAEGLNQAKEAPTKEIVLRCVSNVIQMEQRNQSMNSFVACLFERFKEVGVEALLVKGQGIAHCYEKPLWRACGDVDLLLDNENYERAKQILIPLAVKVDNEGSYQKHLGITFKNGFIVELHGSLRTRLSSRIDNEIDSIQEDIFRGHKYRFWHNKDSEVPLPAVTDDVVFVFTHILHHFFIEGVGLRQICDWCRLLWKSQSELDVRVLLQRMEKMGILSEWKAFAALAVKWLGMDHMAIPLYDPSRKWEKKADRILEYVLEAGNFGHNREKGERKGIIGKVRSLCRRTRDSIRLLPIFPMDSIRFWLKMIATSSL